MAEILAASDSSILVRFGAPTAPLAEALGGGRHEAVCGLLAAFEKGRPPGFLSVSPAYTSVLFRYDPLRLSPSEAEQQVRSWLREPAGTSRAQRHVRIPVCYGGAFGPDLEEMAARCGLSAKQVVERHTGRTYTAYFLGFAPGFAYLGEVEEALAIPRRERPRIRVEAGSVGIAGQQTAIYPLAMPGGWNLIGRTPVPVYFPDGARRTRIEPGDTVWFDAISQEEYLQLREHSGAKESPAMERGAPDGSAGPGRMEVIRAGLQCTVQDGGRVGLADGGISPSGAADPVLLRVGNTLVGNTEGAAAIEITGWGGSYRFHASTLAALAGDFEVWVDGVPQAAFEEFAIPAGGTVRVGMARSGFRGYLCLAGGVDVPLLWGSRSTYLPGGLGGFRGRALRTGDQVLLCPALEAAAGVRRRGLPAFVQPHVDAANAPLRVMAGQHAALFPAAALDDLCSRVFAVQAESNRMGVRLRPMPGFPRERLLLEGSLLSEGVPAGAIQVTPSEECIVLGPDSQTTGGYPILASLISADLRRMAQLRPGAPVRFTAVSLEQARDLLMEQETQFYEWKEGL